jgi:hypothetical protein
MTSINSTVATRLRLLLPAAFIAAVAALVSSAVGDPATAGAMPYNETKYLTCHQYWVAQWQAGKITEKEVDSAIRLCCASSGGEWKLRPESGTMGCVAPAAAQPSLPGTGPLPSLATQTLEPAPPPVLRNPGVVTQTFAPAPVG